MKVLILHAPNDKTLAANIAAMLQKHKHEVWFDLPSDSTTSQTGTLGVYIRKSEVIVFVWSIHAFDTDNISTALQSARLYNKTTIPLSADQTPLDHCNEMKGQLSIPFKEQELGMLLLENCFLFVSVPPERKSEQWYREAFDGINDLTGWLKDKQYYQMMRMNSADEFIELKRDLSANNTRIAGALNAVPQQSNEELSLQSIMQALEKGNNNKADLQRMHAWCGDHEKTNSTIVGKLSEFIQKDIERLDNGGQPVAQLDYAAAKSSIERLSAAIGERKDLAAKSLSDKIRKYSFGFIPDKKLQELVEGCLKYITTCPVTLKILLQEAGMSEYVVVKEVLVKISAYLENQDHGLELRKDNLDGFYDDAYLINHTVQLLIEADLIAEKQYELDFMTMKVVDKYISFMIPSSTKQKLDATLSEVRDLIGLKKKEINWGKVAAVVVGGVLAAQGVGTLAGMFNENNTAASTGAGGNDGGFFEDKMAAFSAKYGGGLNPYSPINYGR